MNHANRRLAALLLPALAVVAGPSLPDALAAEPATRPGTRPARPAAKGQQAAPDLSDPRAAVGAFVDAVFGGDAAGLEAVAFGTPEQFKLMNAMGSLASAFRVMGEAAAERFGPDTPFAAMLDGMNVEAQVARAEIRVDGDTAKVIERGAGGGGGPLGAMTLVRKDGKWRVDLGSMPNAGMDAKMMAAVPAMTAAADEVAADIRGGKYADANAAMAAFGTRMAAAMGVAVPELGPGDIVELKAEGVPAQPDPVQPERQQK